jgi:hypothetical protein
VPARKDGLAVTGELGLSPSGCQRDVSAAIELTRTDPSVRTPASQSRPASSTVVAGEE